MQNAKFKMPARRSLGAGRQNWGQQNIFKFIAIALTGIFLIAVTEASALTIDEAVSIGLQNNPQMIAAQEKLNIASAKMGQAGSGLLPRVSLDASKGRTWQETPVVQLPAAMGGGSFSTSPNEISDYTSYSLTVRQSLFAGGRIITGTKIARVSYDAAQEDLKKSAADTRYLVVSAYCDVVKAKKSLEVVNESMSNLKKTLETTQLFFNAGINSNSDVLRVKTMIANTEIARINSENGLKLAKLALESTLGKKIAKDLELNDIEQDDSLDLRVSNENAITEAFKNRPDWKGYRLGMEAADSAINMAYSGYLPNISLVFTAGKTKTEYPVSTSYNNELASWRTLFVGSWTVFDGLYTQNQIREAYSTLAAAKAQETQIKNGIELEVNAAYLGLLATMEKINASKAAADLAFKTMKSVEASYRSSIATNQSYLDSQTAYQSAKIALLSAQCDLMVAKEKLNKAVGKKVV